MSLLEDLLSSVQSSMNEMHRSEETSEGVCPERDANGEGGVGETGGGGKEDDDGGGSDRNDPEARRLHWDRSPCFRRSRCDSGGRRPVLVRLAESLGLSPDTTALPVVRFLVVAKAYRSDCLRSLLPSDGGSLSDRPSYPSDNGEGCPPSLIEYVCGLSRLDLTPLVRDDTHPLVKDGTIRVGEDDLMGERKLSVPDEVCQALLGKELDAEDRLRLSGTHLLAILDGLGHGGSGPELSAEDIGTKTRGVGSDGGRRPFGVAAGTVSALATVEEMLRDLNVGAKDGGAGASTDSSDEVDGEDVNVKFNVGIKPDGGGGGHGIHRTGAKD